MTTDSWVRRGKEALGLVLLLCVFTRAAVAQLVNTLPGVKPSVLMVGSYQETANPRFTFRGTGFAVLDGNKAVTNAHVLPPTTELVDGRRLVVQVAEGVGRWSQRNAEVLVEDRSHDLALISFEGAALRPLKLAEAAEVREGMDIALIGFPLAGAVGYTAVTHRGIVAAKTYVVLPPPDSHTLSGRAIRQLREGSFELLQLDATAYPGNSGGPVFDPANGEVLGVVSMVAVKGTRESALSSPTGITYAVPSAAVLDLIQQVKH